MKQCETCEFRPFKDDILSCQTAQLKYEWTELKKQLPFIGKYIKDYECPEWLRDCRIGDTECK